MEKVEGIAARFGFDQPILTLKISTQNGDTPVLLRFGRARGQLYAQNRVDNVNNADAGTVFVLSFDALTSIQSALDKIFPTPQSRPKNDSTTF